MSVKFVSPFTNCKFVNVKKNIFYKFTFTNLQFYIYKWSIWDTLLQIKLFYDIKKTA